MEVGLMHSYTYTMLSTRSKVEYLGKSKALLHSLVTDVPCFAYCAIFSPSMQRSSGCDGICHKRYRKVQGIQTFQNNGKMTVWRYLVRSNADSSLFGATVSHKHIPGLQEYQNNSFCGTT